MEDLFALIDAAKAVMQFISDWWMVLIWAVPVLVGCLFLWSWLGPKFSWPAWALGLAVVFLKVGEKIGRDKEEKRQKDIQEKSRKGYKKIHTGNLRDLFARFRNR